MQPNNIKAIIEMKFNLLLNLARCHRKLEVSSRTPDLAQNKFQRIYRGLDFSFKGLSSLDRLVLQGYRYQAGLLRSVLFESSRQKGRQTAGLGAGRSTGGLAALPHKWRHQEAHLENQRRKVRCCRLHLFDVKWDDEERETAAGGAFAILKIDLCLLGKLVLFSTFSSYTLFS